MRERHRSPGPAPCKDDPDATGVIHIWPGRLPPFMFLVCSARERKGGGRIGYRLLTASLGCAGLGTLMPVPPGTRSRMLGTNPVNQGSLGNGEAIAARGFRAIRLAPFNRDVLPADFVVDCPLLWPFGYTFRA